MDNVFPTGVPGLDVQNVIYRYTVQKDVNDQLDVTVQNKNALGSGYVFQETDRWMPGSLGGTEINKAVPVIPNIPRAAWGDGSITTSGTGSVTDASVIYTYKVDPCFDPQSNPLCPGYKVVIPEIPQVDLSMIYDATKDENIQDQEVDRDLIEKEDSEEKSEEELEKEQAEEEKDSEERLEKALAAAQTAGMFADALASSMMMDTMDKAINMNSYYGAKIPGGSYNERVRLIDKQLPESKRGLRNGLAQQILHNKMIEMQYKKK